MDKTRKDETTRENITYKITNDTPITMNKTVTIERKPFFVHIPKNMGNFIYQNYGELPHSYSDVSWTKNGKTKYYGLYDSIYEYYNLYKIPYKRPSKSTPYDHSVSIDHLTPLEMIQLNVWRENPNQYIFFSIVREPIDRFISLCNYWDVPPEQLIYNMERIDLLKMTKYNLYQHFRPQSDYIEDMKRLTPHCHIFSMNKKNEIRDFLAGYFPDKIVDYDERVYHSRDKYTVDMISLKHMNFIKTYYEKDMELFQTL
jgi:hypothetical protein